MNQLECNRHIDDIGQPLSATGVKCQHGHRGANPLAASANQMGPNIGEPPLTRTEQLCETLFDQFQFGR